MAIQRFEDLEVWQLSHNLVLNVYNITQKLPENEKYGLVSQMRRSAVSVPANIAEGFKRKGNKDKIRFYNIAQASLEELRYYFILCNDLNYGSYNELNDKFTSIGKMLNRLVYSINNN